ALEELIDVRLVEHVLERDEPAQREPAREQMIADLRKASEQARGPDAPAGGALREVELAHQAAERGGVAELEREMFRIEFRELDEKHDQLSLLVFETRGEALYELACEGGRGLSIHDISYRTRFPRHLGARRAGSPTGNV